MVNITEVLRAQYPGMMEKIKETAHQIHASVNQHYDDKPYAHHLDMVVDNVLRYGNETITDPRDALPVYFGAYFHDSIEDARLTYNDVMSIARGFMDEDQAYLATEIAYALTNEKGRTRQERANNAYYRGIRRTPYAPMIKLADRLANFSYSMEHDNKPNHSIKQVYFLEMNDFLRHIRPKPDKKEDPRFMLPQQMLERIYAMMHQIREENRKAKAKEAKAKEGNE